MTEPTEARQDELARIRERVDKIISELRHKIEVEHYDFHYDYAVEARDQIIPIIQKAERERIMAVCISLWHDNLSNFPVELWQALQEGEQGE